MECEVCGDSGSLSYTCNGCHNHYCSKHRLPESHKCASLRLHDPKESETWFSDKYQRQSVMSNVRKPNRRKQKSKPKPKRRKSARSQRRSRRESGKPTSKKDKYRRVVGRLKYRFERKKHQFNLWVMRLKRLVSSFLYFIIGSILIALLILGLFTLAGFGGYGPFAGYSI